MLAAELLGWIYVIVALGLSLYGFHEILLLILYLLHRGKKAPPPELKETPFVTIQLPIYNEAHVVERLIDAVANLDYPRDRFEIQVLDDSTDETIFLAEEKARKWRRQGVNVTVLHRGRRDGFKAGALAEGLKYARGEFIAIFDADFIPQPDFLRRTIPYFLRNPRLGMVQVRWGHLNRDYSPLTRAQAIALDGHFVVEQTARNRTGLFMNFNGSGGVWRKSCIEDAGGWHKDTLSEDMDLSYRAQLKGWQCLYLPEVVAPAEIPPQLNAFKRQQFRWAKGSIQCLMKLGSSLLRSHQPWFRKAEGIIHLSSYLIHPLMVIMLLLILPLMLLDFRIHLPLTYLSMASLGPPLVYLFAENVASEKGVQEMAYFPILALLGVGIALNNTKAVWEALTRRQNRFGRTPKFRLYHKNGRWAGSPYALSFEGVIVGEIALALYALAAIAVAWLKGRFFAIPFLLLYLGGFGYVGLLGVWHSLLPLLQRRRKSTIVPLKVTAGNKGR